ncbi:hypothetical protein V4C53_47845, partial [Paraburkholderia azotifigens]
LGAATALDVVANSTRRRRRAQPEPVTHATTPGPNLLELVHQRGFARMGTSFRAMDATMHF